MSSSTLLNVVVQLYAVRFPLNVVALIVISSSFHVGIHPGCRLTLYWSSTVKEQGTVTQDPLSVITLAGTRTLNSAALHPAPLKQEVDKSKGSIDAQTVTIYFKATLNFLKNKIIYLNQLNYY